MHMLAVLSPLSMVSGFPVWDWFSFLQGPVDIFVSISNVDEVNPKDEPLKITVPSLSENVLSVKDKIASDIHHPAKKLKLFGKFGFLKNNMSLAYYNVGSGEKLALSLNQRGGRKRWTPFKVVVGTFLLPWEYSIYYRETLLLFIFIDIIVQMLLVMYY